MLTERQRRFAVAYARLANGTKAAIEAGYSEKTAAVAASKMVRNSNILAAIESYRIRRDVHADTTYGNLIALADSSLKILQEALNDPNLEFREKMMAYENARRCNETLATCEGLMARMPPAEKKNDEFGNTLQILAQKLREPIKSLPAPQSPSEGKVVA